MDLVTDQKVMEKDLEIRKKLKEYSQLVSIRYLERSEGNEKIIFIIFGYI